MAANSYSTGKTGDFHDAYVSVDACGVVDGNAVTSSIRRILGNVGSCYGVIFVQKGEISAIIKSRDIIINENEIILFFPGELQDIICERTSSVFRYVFFNGYAVPEILAQCVFSGSGVYDVSDAGIISDTLARMMLAFTRNAPAIRINSLLLHLLSEISCERKKTKRETHSDISCLEKIFKARELMETEYRNARKVSEYANVCSMSPGRFSTVFEKAVGKPPKKYIQDLKIDKACELLRHTAMTVTAAARSSGFSDSLYFSRVFRKRFGVSPDKYRKMSSEEISEL